MNKFALILIIVAIIGSIDCHKSRNSSCSDIANSETCAKSLSTVHIQLGKAYLNFIQSFESLADSCDCVTLISEFYLNGRHVGDQFYKGAITFLLDPASNCQNYCSVAITALDGMENFFSEWDAAYESGQIPNKIQKSVSRYISKYRKTVNGAFEV